MLLTKVYVFALNGINSMHLRQQQCTERMNLTRKKKSTDEVNEASGGMKSTCSKCYFRINARKKKKKLGKTKILG